MAGSQIIGYAAILFILILNICSSAQKAKPKETITSLKRKLMAQNNKIKVMTKEIEEIKKKLAMVDQAQGILDQRPPCTINGRNIPHFYYEESMKSCYSIENSSLMVNATQAETHCKRSDSHLVSIESKKEQDFLRAMWKNAYGISTISRFWTSGIMRDGEWEWEASGKKFKYENWVPTTPHNDERFTCMAILSNENYYWADVACWAPNIVTCEISNVNQA